MLRILQPFFKRDGKSLHLYFKILLGAILKGKEGSKLFPLRVAPNERKGR